MTRPLPPSQARGQTGPTGSWAPPPIRSMRDVGLNIGILSDLAIKTLYFGGYLNGNEVADQMHLPFTGVIELVLETLKREKFVEVRGGGGGLGSGAYEYVLTLRGLEKAHEALARTQYAGPCPVTQDHYDSAINQQARARLTVHRDLARKGAARDDAERGHVRSHRPAVKFRQGDLHVRPAGNGKTTIAQSRDDDPGAPMWIPYAVDIDGQVVRRLRQHHHQVLPDDDDPQRRVTATGERRDPRWLRIPPPVIRLRRRVDVETLDLVYDTNNKYYEAPFQMKANGGMFLIDDFGRQQVPPRDLLNRWIVPLESRVDFSTLSTGRKIEIRLTC